MNAAENSGENPVIEDILIEPKCAQCTIKHLSAALAFTLGPQYDPYSGSYQFIFSPTGQMGYYINNGAVYFAQAFINLSEVKNGYNSHLWYAVGLLVRCEDHCLTSVDNDPRSEGLRRCAREARLILELNNTSEDKVRKAISTLSEFLPLVSTAEFVRAHMDEAVREFPWGVAEVDKEMIGLLRSKITPETILKIIYKVREEFLGLPDIEEKPN